MLEYSCVVSQGKAYRVGDACYFDGDKSDIAKIVILGQITGVFVVGKNNAFRFFPTCQIDELYGTFDKTEPFQIQLKNIGK